MRVNKLQRELLDYKQQYDNCQVVIVNSHSGAEAVRAKLNEELGVSVFQSGTSMPSQQTAT